MPDVAYCVRSMKRLIWIGSSKQDLVAFPDEVKRVMGFALFQAQEGGKHPDARPLKGFGGAGVLEIVEDYDGDTYRGVYTVRFDTAVYVLHAFQKKSRHGIATPKHDLELIRARLGRARERHEQQRGGR
ncbi:MAG TPA: type II toxin-antitoxin system RelE/ParE family toxin [Chloroflexota bacterium]